MFRRLAPLAVIAVGSILATGAVAQTGPAKAGVVCPVATRVMILDNTGRAGDKIALSDFTNMKVAILDNTVRPGDRIKVLDQLLRPGESTMILDNTVKPGQKVAILDNTVRGIRFCIVPG
jgi:hypothetical protein